MLKWIHDLLLVYIAETRGDCDTAIPSTSDEVKYRFAVSFFARHAENLVFHQDYSIVANHSELALFDVVMVRIL